MDATALKPADSSEALLSLVSKLWPPYCSVGAAAESSAVQAAHDADKSSLADAETSAGDAFASSSTDLAEEITPMATHHDISHVYGEVVVISFCEFLRSNQWLGSADAPATFVDLGSGSGACVAAAVASGCFKRCIGIELEEDWFQCSTERFRALEAAALEEAAAADPLSPSWTTFRIGASSEDTTGACAVAVKQGSMFEAAWVADACPDKQPAVVFCNATALNIPQMQQLAQVCEKLPAGSIVLTTTAALPSRLFDAHKLADRLPMSWGSTATVHVAVRKKLGKWAARMLPRY